MKDRTRKDSIVSFKVNMVSFKPQTSGRKPLKLLSRNLTLKIWSEADACVMTQENKDLLIGIRRRYDSGFWRSKDLRVARILSDKIIQPERYGVYTSALMGMRIKKTNGEYSLHQRRKVEELFHEYNLCVSGRAKTPRSSTAKLEYGLKLTKKSIDQRLESYYTLQEELDQV